MSNPKIEMRVRGGTRAQRFLLRLFTRLAWWRINKIHPEWTIAQKHGWVAGEIADVMDSWDYPSHIKLREHGEDRH